MKNVTVDNGALGGAQGGTASPNVSVTVTQTPTMFMQEKLGATRNEQLTVQELNFEGHMSALGDEVQVGDWEVFPGDMSKASFSDNDQSEW